MFQLVANAFFIFLFFKTGSTLVLSALKPFLPPLILPVDVRTCLPLCCFSFSFSRFFSTLLNTRSFFFGWNDMDLLPVSNLDVSGS